MVQFSKETRVETRVETRGRSFCFENINMGTETKGPSPFTFPFTCSIYQPTGLSANQVFYAAVKRSRQGEQPGGGSLPYVLGSLLILLDHAERYTGAL